MYKPLVRLMAGAALAATTLLAPASHAQPAQTAPAGQKYVAVTPPQATDTPGKVEVLEFFSYNCPHCAVMEPLVVEWAKKQPDDVVLKQVPVAFSAAMKPMQQLFYALQDMKRPDLHPKVFDAIHTQRKRLFDKKAMSEWAVSQGLDKAKFEATFDSFSVNTQVARADQLVKAYNIDGTPSFGVGGKYLTSPVLAGNSYEGALGEVDRLIPMVRSGAK